MDRKSAAPRQYFRMNTILLAAILVNATPPEHELRKGNPCAWEQLFRQGTATGTPCGSTRGTVLAADGKLPKLKARAQSTVWKGKTFHGDGTFTNRWLGGVKAVSATVCQGTSWLDGQPCLVMQYPPNAAVFGNVRDELREISPGLWLGRSYDAGTGQGKNWFVLNDN
jgi:hypothetical protein